MFLCQRRRAVTAVVFPLREEADGDVSILGPSAARAGIQDRHAPLVT